MNPIESYTVLVTLADAESVELCESWLADEYDVHTVVGDDEVGPEVADADVVLVDRGFPTYADGELTPRTDRDSCLVAVVSAVDADRGAVEVSCTESLADPPTRSRLLEGIERIRRRGAYDDALAACAELAAERGRLEAEHTSDELAADETYRTLCRDLEALEERVDTLQDSFDEVDYCAAFGAPDFAGARRVQRVGWPC